MMLETRFKTLQVSESKGKYFDLRISNKQTESYGVRVNEQYIAFPWETRGGGTLCLIPRCVTGRIKDPLLFKGHAGSILDFEFSPFYESMFATCSEDGLAKLWEAPVHNPKQKLKDPLCQLKGHEKRVSFVTFNPCADFIAATASLDGSTKIWNLEDASEYVSLACDVPTHLRWNLRGDLLAVAAKDKLLRVLDPRNSNNTNPHSFVGHDGSRGFKCEWLNGVHGNDHLILTIGFSKDGAREMKVWDLRKTSQSASYLDIDRGTSTLYPIWDESGGLLFIWGRGDSCIRAMAFKGDCKPYKLEEFRSTKPAKGIALLPKRCVDVMELEADRLFKAEDTTTIQPISFTVPRRAINPKAFDKDLFTDCLAAEPAMVASCWIRGETAHPLRQSLDPTTTRQQTADHAIPPILRRRTETVVLGGTTTLLSAAPTSRAVLEKELISSEQELVKLRGMVFDLQKHVKELEAQAVQLSLDRAPSTLSSNQVSTQELHDSMKALESQLNEKDAQLSKKDTQLLAVEADVSELKCQLETAQRQLEALQSVDQRERIREKEARYQEDDERSGGEERSGEEEGSGKGKTERIRKNESKILLTHSECGSPIFGQFSITKEEVLRRHVEELETTVEEVRQSYLEASAKSYSIKEELDRALLELRHRDEELQSINGQLSESAPSSSTLKPQQLPQVLWKKIYSIK